MVQEAETALAAYVTPQPGKTLVGASAAAFVAGLAIFSLVEFFGGMLFGRSPILHLFGIAIVNRRGWPATRGRLLWRWVLIWLPLGALSLAAGIFVSVNIIPSHSGAIWTTLVPSATAVVFLAALLDAALHPERSLADRLAGTGLAPL